MAVRNEWNIYKLGDSLDIWGNPDFKGVPVFSGGFTLGDAVTDTLTLNGRIATGSVAGAPVDIDATYTYDALMELRADVSSWAGIGGTDFYGQYLRVSTSVDSAADSLYAQQIYAANADGIDVAMMESAIFNTMGKGNSTIAMMRGAEIKCEWLATDTITNAVGLVIEFMGLAAPANTIIGLKFEKASAAGAMVPFFHEIQMKEGLHIISRTATPVGAGVNAPQGSLCLVTTGASVAACAFINTDGADTWTNLT